MEPVDKTYKPGDQKYNTPAVQKPVKATMADYRKELETQIKQQENNIISAEGYILALRDVLKMLPHE